MQKPTFSKSGYAVIASVLSLFLFAAVAAIAQGTPEQTASDATLAATLKLRAAADTLSKAADAVTAANTAVAITPPAIAPLSGGSAVMVSASPLWKSILDGLVQSALAVVSMVLTGLIAVYVPRALNVFEAKTGVQLTEQQQATVLQAAQTARGILETKLDQGIVHIGQIAFTDPAVVEQANAAIARVPDAAARLGKSVHSLAEIIVGLVDTQSRTAPKVVAPAPPVVVSSAPVVPPSVPKGVT
jgi:hypothetical protein